MDRYVASFSRGGGGARPTGAREVRRSVRVADIALLFLSTVVFFLTVVCVASAAFSTSASALGTPHAQALNSPVMTMVTQTPWVKPGESFDIAVAISSSEARSQLGIALSVYAPPEGQSSFEETLSGNTSSESLLSDTQTIPLTSLATDAHGDVLLSVGITAGNAQAPSSAVQLNLSCLPLTCNGVYPLRVQLMDTADGTVIGSLITHIIYVESNVASRLRVSLVVPVGAAPSGSEPNGTQKAPSGSALTRLATLVNELASSPAPLTMLAQPQTVQALEAGSAAARNVASGIVATSDNASAQVLDGSYVWVNPEALVDSGLSSEITQQLARGVTVLGDTHVQTFGNTALLDAGVDSQTLSALDASGISQVILPSNYLTTVSGRFAGPSVQTFDIDIPLGRKVEAAQTDPALQTELTNDQGSGAVLGAHQLLADLALIAFEEPDASWARGVPLAPGLNWSPSPSFLSTLLSGLSSMPVVDPLTLSSFFTEVAKGDDGGNPDNGNGWPRTRQLESGSSRASAFPSSALSTARTKLGGLVSVVSGGPVNLTPLGDALLSSESIQLTFNEQVSALSALDNLIEKRASVVSLTAYHTIRITSQTATIPITLVRNVSYPVWVVLHLSSDKLGFLHGTNPRKVQLTRHIQSFDVDVFARTAGDFPVVVSVRSPKGGLLITSATFTVRSLSTSVVAIVLSAVAVAVLLAWWGRTLVTRRRSRRGSPGHKNSGHGGSGRRGSGRSTRGRGAHRASHEDEDQATLSPADTES